MVRELRTTAARAHEQAIRAHAALQRKALLNGGTARIERAPVPVTSEARFKPLARTAVGALDATALAALAVGDIAGVFGTQYRQDGANPDIRTSGTLLTSVTGMSLHGGPYGRGRLAARAVGAIDRDVVVDAVVQAAEVFALYLGLHLCFADATLVRGIPWLPAEPVRVEFDQELSAEHKAVDLVVDVSAVDLVPRPFLRVDAELLVGGVAVGRVAGVTVAVCEKPGVSIGPEHGGKPARWLGRLGRFGDRAMLGEFHLAQLCRGDHGIALGPEFAHYSSIKSTRPPDRGLLLVDRIMDMTGERGILSRGSHRTEYDSPADSWYYEETANASMPNCVHMESSLQAALILGYFLGPTLSASDAAVSLRNLGGTATVLREVDLRDKTIVQDSDLLSTSPVPGATLQTFAYTACVDGEPFYSGETLFGYFSDAAMANQTGLDAGRHVPTWWDAQRSRPATRTIDIVARRADPAARLVSRGHLALLDAVQVVDGGGEFGLGYLRAVQPIDPEHWVFTRHFRYDPVIPGSFGVEAVVHAMQEWLLDSGLGDDLRDPGFVLPVGLPFTWKYRGQFLPTDGQYVLEVHIKSVEHRPGRVRAVGDASMWKPGLRIYELTDIAVELREEGARPW
ncbi:beta-ketoacyl synthase [Streptomyces botrytidirepellens]|uniref:beta-ketoacyl synthase n=1 Tax=Streptomyces botrytidirepellens TaxID=2486417 RepID=UPI001FE8641C|nr:beta-ketoacyl synthase [Streptomyces botrytidirepellens]